MDKYQVTVKRGDGSTQTILVNASSERMARMLVEERYVHHISKVKKEDEENATS